MSNSTPSTTLAETDRVGRAVDAIAAGRSVIVMDGEDSDSEGVLVFAADLATSDLVSFMVRYTSGYVSVAITEAEADRLDLPPMHLAGSNQARAGYTVTVDAREGVGTGISARDRAHTIRLLADPATSATDLSRPGHVVPIRVRDGGVLRRPGHAEASVDLAAFAGRRPAAALCGVVSQLEPTGMARGAELRDFAESHQLAVLTIADVVAHRQQTERLVRRAAQARMPLAGGVFTAIGYESDYDDRQHLALLIGDLADGENVLVSVHAECPTGDIFGSLRCDCRVQLEASLAAVAAAGRGIVLYLRAREGRGVGLLHDLQSYQLLDCGLDTVDVDFVLGLPTRAGDYGTAAQILVDLGVRTLRLLTNSPGKLPGLDGYGLTVVGQIPVPLEASASNQQRRAAKHAEYALALVRDAS